MEELKNEKSIEFLVCITLFATAILATTTTFADETTYDSRKDLLIIIFNRSGCFSWYGTPSIN
ncbi:hypothetical protein [Enterococcus thailandicus]|uniref:hypothetical protein n=1 Tax=Enterococcus thailandicus TaxID=417368 RepID=UPI0018D4DA11|nr:hypothetical protein [Enterococcus thailandicus]